MRLVQYKTAGQNLTENTIFQIKTKHKPDIDMKIMTLLALAMFCFGMKAETVKTEIKNVMVYRQGAMVDRSGVLDVPKGTNTVLISGLSTTLNPQSIRVAIGNEYVTIVSVNHELNYGDDAKVEKESAATLARIALMRDSLSVFVSQNEILENEKSLILENKNIGGDKGVSATELAAMAQYFRKGLTDIENLIRKNNKLIDRYKKDISLLIQQNQNRQKESHPLISQVKLVLSSSLAYKAVPIKISYLVADASWRPFYEVRIKETDKPLQLVYSAKVTQNSKEDWNNVNITLSTGDPSISNVRPEFYTMYLPPVFRPLNSGTNIYGASVGMVQGYVRDEKGEPIIGATVAVENDNIGCTTNIDGYFKLKVPSMYSNITISYIGCVPQTIKAKEYMDIALKTDIQALDEVVVVGYGKRNKKVGLFASSANKNVVCEEEEVADMAYSGSVNFNMTAAPQIPMQIEQNQSATEFKIELPYTIVSDGKDYDVKMLEYNIPAQYQYSAAPRYSSETFLMARIPDWTRYALMDGNASLYLKNIYQGESVIAPKATQDTLELSIGRDKDIAISRKELRNYTSHSLIGSTRKVQKHWEITVKNNKNIATEIEVEDQYPISKHDDIKISLLEAKGAKVDAQTGKITWKIKLEPKETQTLKFCYEVKYPNSYTFIVE